MSDGRSASRGPESIVDGRYRVEGVLGEGSMGAVLRARHVLTDNMVALKRIHPDAVHREVLMARFRREVSVSAHVQHDGIVRVFDAGEEPDGSLYLVMELLTGQTLKQRSEQAGFTAGYGLNVVRALLEPLAAVHAAGIVHRDIKPENIFLHRRPDGRDQVKLLDFGIARDPRHPSTTRSDVGIGTPYYMSPEQATNARAVTSASDVWSVGVVMYWLLSGRLPFAGDTPFNTLAQACSAPHRPLELAGGETAHRLAQLVDSALSKSAEERPTDAADLLTKLNAILGPTGSDDSWSAIAADLGITEAWPPPLTAAETVTGVVAAFAPTDPNDSTIHDAAPAKTRRPPNLAALVAVLLAVALAVVLLAPRVSGPSLSGPPVSSAPGSATESPAPAAVDTPTAPSEAPVPTERTGEKADVAHSDSSDRADEADRTIQADHAGRTSRAGGAKHARGAGGAKHTDRTGGARGTDRAGRTDRADRADRADRGIADRHDRADHAARSAAGRPLSVPDRAPTDTTSSARGAEGSDPPSSSAGDPVETPPKRDSRTESAADPAASDSTPEPPPPPATKAVPSDAGVAPPPPPPRKKRPQFLTF